MSTEYVLPHTHQSLVVTERSCKFELDYHSGEVDGMGNSDAPHVIAGGLESWQIGDIAVELMKIISYNDPDILQSIKDKINDSVY